MIALEELHALVDQPLPGGTYRIEEYENWLVSDVVGAPLLAGGLAHPLYIYLAAMGGMGMSVDDLFTLVGATAADGPMFGEATIEQHRPLRTATTYEVKGHITGIVRKTGGRIGVFDIVTFRLELTDPTGELAGVSLNSFVFPRAASAPPPAEDTTPAAGSRAVPAPPASGTNPDDVGAAVIPPFVVECVDPEKMKIMAAVLRDSNPIHFDVDAVRRLGLGDAVVNQGPNNIGYLLNMLLAWLDDPTRFRSLSVRFQANVYAGERVVATGRVGSTHERSPTDQLTDCAVWLQRSDGERVMTGNATVVLP